MNKKQKLGSKTAKQGFTNEKEIATKFNNWKKDIEAKSWLKIMNYELIDIEYVKAIIVSGNKTDVQVQITVKLTEQIDVENIQVKLVSNLKGFNQIDKRWLDKYKMMWFIPDDILRLLKKYTGELKPTIGTPRDFRRTFANEFQKADQQKLLSWLESNKLMIVSDIMKGRGKLAAEWMLVAQKTGKNSHWILQPMNVVINHFGRDEVVITKRGNIKIGRITMQRKGGDGGRETAKMLQFKINPAELFEVTDK